jgi:hypothetical protein
MTATDAWATFRENAPQIVAGHRPDCRQLSYVARSTCGLNFTTPLNYVVAKYTRGSWADVNSFATLALCSFIVCVVLGTLISCERGCLFRCSSGWPTRALSVCGPVELQQRYLLRHLARRRRSDARFLCAKVSVDSREFGILWRLRLKS